jgi:hypothetical protein
MGGSRKPVAKEAAGRAEKALPERVRARCLARDTEPGVRSAFCAEADRERVAAVRATACPATVNHRVRSVVDYAVVG